MFVSKNIPSKFQRKMTLFVRNPPPKIMFHMMMNEGFSNICVRLHGNKTEAMFPIIIREEHRNIFVTTIQIFMLFQPYLSIKEDPCNHGSNHISILTPSTIFLSIYPLHHCLARRMVFQVCEALLSILTFQKLAFL